MDQWLGIFFIWASDFKLRNTLSATIRAKKQIEQYSSVWWYFLGLITAYTYTHTSPSVLPPSSGCLVLALVFAQSLPPTPTPWLLPNLNYPSLIYHIAWYLKVCHLQTDKTGFEFWFHDLSGPHHVKKNGTGDLPGGLVVGTLPSKAGVGSILDQGC